MIDSSHKLLLFFIKYIQSMTLKLFQSHCCNYREDRLLINNIIFCIIIRTTEYLCTDFLLQRVTEWFKTVHISSLDKQCGYSMTECERPMHDSIVHTFTEIIKLFSHTIFLVHNFSILYSAYKRNREQKRNFD